MVLSFVQRPERSRQKAIAVSHDLVAVPSGLEEVASPFRQDQQEFLGYALPSRLSRALSPALDLRGHSPELLATVAGRAKPLPQVQKAQPSLSRDSLLLLSAYCPLLTAY